MKILHGTWIPDHTSDFIQTGNFYIWIETTETNAIAIKRKSSKAIKVSEDLLAKHPASLSAPDLKSFLYNDLAIKDDLLQEPANKRLSKDQIIFPKYFLLPTSEKQPLPSTGKSTVIKLLHPSKSVATTTVVPLTLSNC